MKFRLLLTVALLLECFCFVEGRAQDDTPAPSPPIAELRALVKKVNAKVSKMEASVDRATVLAPEIAEFDALLAKYHGKGEDRAKIALAQAGLFVVVLRDEAKGRHLLEQMKVDFPGTRAAANAERQLALLTPEAKAKAAAEAAASQARFGALTGRAAPELHFIWSSKEGLKALSDLKGKVVVLDFWTTWCGPCIGSFPQVREHVARFKDSPVVFLGVTSLQGFVANLGARIDTKGDPAKELSLMPRFMKEKGMTWDVVFSQEKVFNPDYGIEGIPYVAIIAPDGTVRHAGLHPGNPAADIAGRVTAILREFNLPVPKAK